MVQSDAHVKDTNRPRYSAGMEGRVRDPLGGGWRSCAKIFWVEIIFCVFPELAGGSVIAFAVWELAELNVFYVAPPLLYAWCSVRNMGVSCP